MKYLNIVIFLFLSTLFLLFSSEIKFSTNFLEVFFSPKSIELFSITSKLGLSNNIYIAKKGFNKKSLDELEGIAKKLKKIEGIKKVTISLSPSKSIEKYYKKNYYLLADFNKTTFSKKNIYTRLKKKYEELQNSYIYTPLDTNDPLDIFKIPVDRSKKYLKLKNYGYVLKAKTSINTSSAEEATVLYDKINNVIYPYHDVLAYAPFFFLVENSSYIQNDTQRIIAIATILLFLLYLVVLRSYRLLFHTVIAISSSILAAILASAYFFESINIMVLAFGISISTISIDYMFHYYFHGDFSAKRFIWRKKVFFGFLTSFGVFVIFSFIDIKLFYELAFFSAVSLAVSYLIFSLVFGYLGLDKPKFKTKNKSQNQNFNPVVILFFSLLLLGYSFTHLKFDSNLRNLDYKNVKLLKLSKQFQEGLFQNNYKIVLINANSEELVLQKYENLQKKYPSILGIGKFVLSHEACIQRVNKLKAYNFNMLRESIKIEAKKIGFNNVFNNTYAGMENMSCKNIHQIDIMDFKIIKEANSYYTMAFIPKDKKLLPLDGVEILDISSHLSKDMQKSKQSIVKFMIISICFIIIMLFLASGINILYPLVYILFPLGIVLFTISLLGSINIMHMFAMVILIAISIDYGVYMHNTKTLTETRMAIRYALLSTLAGFGVLVFSDTVALHSIGLVISMGIITIFTLLYWRKI